MPLFRTRFRLDSLLLLTAFVALALGGLRTWQADQARRPRPSERFARSLLDARAAGQMRPGVPGRDDLFAAGLAGTVFAGAFLVRRFSR